MPLEEWEVWSRGDRTADYYQRTLREAAQRRDQAALRPKVIHPEAMPWEDSPQGRVKHVTNEHAWGEARVDSLDVYIQQLPPGGRSGKHRHTAEEAFFVLEGRGYDLHWNVEADLLPDGVVWKVAEKPQRFDWKAGDAVTIPVNTVHQHFNADPGRPARFITATNRVYRALGYGDIQQFEAAPDHGRQ